MRILLRLVLLALLLAGVAVGYFSYAAGSPWRGWQQPVFVDIAPGTPTRAIASRLQGAGVLRDRWTFLALRYLSPAATLKAGEYLFDQPLSPREVFDKLRRGDVYYHALRVIEGTNIFEIADVAAATGLVARDQMWAALNDPRPIADLDPAAKNLEGYLFPDTYLFQRRVTAEKIVAAMVARFRAVYKQVEARHHPSRPLRELVTMASLVEEETGVPAERPVVAGVFFNRLQQNMPLQCDPTVVYAALLAGRYRGTIYQSDLAFDSPYNTYRNSGLPPGPVSSPGRASLEAAMAPAATDFLFFVKGEGGGHQFSRTLSEHGRAVSEYRRRESQTPAPPPAPNR